MIAMTTNTPEPAERSEQTPASGASSGTGRPLPDPSAGHQAIAPGVRLAMPAEAMQIAQIQRRAWDADPLTKPFLAEVTLEDMAEVWHRSIVRPPLATNRVLVATEPEGAPVPTDDGGTGLASRVVGFAIVGPAQDEDAVPGADGELDAFTVDLLARGRGHTSRLLNAAIDTLKADGYLRALTWVPTTDDDLRRLLQDSGWGPDGAHRELAANEDDRRVKQVRLHTDISPEG